MTSRSAHAQVVAACSMLLAGCGQSPGSASGIHPMSTADVSSQPVSSGTPGTLSSPEEGLPSGDSLPPVSSTVTVITAAPGMISPATTPRPCRGNQDLTYRDSASAICLLRGSQVQVVLSPPPTGGQWSGVASMNPEVLVLEEQHCDQTGCVARFRAGAVGLTALATYSPRVRTEPQSVWQVGVRVVQS